MSEPVPAAASSWLDDVAIGALAGGVNRPTSTLLVAVCAALLVPESALLAVALRKGYAVGHCCALIVLTLLLLGLLTWYARGTTWLWAPRPLLRKLYISARRFLSEVGLVSAQSQRKELGLIDAPLTEAQPQPVQDTKKTD
jgi:hypothetical protein